MSATASASHGPGRGECAPRVAVEQHEQRIGRRQHDDEIFRPQRAAEGEAEQQPVPEASALERGVKGVAGQRPERQLNDVVIELHRRVLEIMHAIDDQHGDERAGRADQRPRRGKDQGKGDDHHGLRQRVIGGIGSEQPVHDLDQPPRQRRQLVVAELPFAAVGQGLDEIERQIGVKQRRQRGPDRKMQGQEAAERGLRPALDPADQSGRRRRAGCRCIGLCRGGDAGSGIGAIALGAGSSDLAL